MSHGRPLPLADVKNALDGIRKTLRELGLASSPIKFCEFTPFDYMFSRLQEDPGALLPTSEKMVEHLVALGSTMSEPDDSPEADSAVPSAYTYFGQFVDHDITQELYSERVTELDDPNLSPLTRAVVKTEIKNTRTPTLDLDCVYGTMADGEPVHCNQSSLVVGSVSDSGDRPPGKGDENDVPRMSVSDDPRLDRKALIGDARNDEHLIISQLHVAFLRAHHALAGRGHTFNEARTLLRQHYQWIVIQDYLKRLTTPGLVDEILTHGCKFFRPKPYELYLPLEFSVAAFRFGHSMVRSTYNYNVNFQSEQALTLAQLFTLAAFRGWPKTYNTLPENMIIDWKKFMDGGDNKARQINTRVVEPLYKLRGGDGQVIKGHGASLAVRNLLRGYLLRMPAGQYVARALGFRPLSVKELEGVAESANAEQLAVMRESGLLERTPLWYYILAEAAATGSTLGPVGGTIVAEVLIGMVRQSEDSILARPGWKPTLGDTPGRFTLRELFRLAEVWG